ncbi:MAG: helix-turn-helix domain-containing protein, partial [Acetobacteraceae bacterium]|nr:helix-turn-helix domain-containing protein [Acetobacteraceae bacterium]
MEPKLIRSFARGLAVLSALNRHGSATALTLARETGVPRATVYRLLQTLLDGGYLGRGTADDRFHLRLKVRSLSGGFADEQWISAIAGPALEELTRRISWPCDISTLHGLKMVIHDTTHPIAPLSIDRNMVGQELSLLGSASGLAYIAFAPKQERDALLALLARSSDPHDTLARDPAQVSRLIASTRRRGYGLRQGGQI